MSHKAYHQHLPNIDNYISDHSKQLWNFKCISILNIYTKLHAVPDRKERSKKVMKQKF